jgi:hypothetical protein
LEITIPVSSDAEGVIPVNPEMTQITLREGDHVVWQNGPYLPGDAGVKAARQEGGNIVVSFGSGRYLFELTGK